MVPPHPSDRSHARRLDGWKQIAAYVNRGVRTAQRWERELGMPVHRLNTGSAEVVYALPDEVDTWLRRQSRSTLAATAADDVSEPPRGNGGATSAGAGGVQGLANRSRSVRVLVGLAVLAVAFFAYRLAAPRGPNPVRVEGAGSTLTAFGPHGEVAWTCVFETPLSEAADRVTWNTVTRLADLDGDGINEVLFARTDFSDPTVYVLDDGRRRVRHRIGRSARFGGVPFGPPWLARGVFMAPDGRSFAVASHVSTEFAAVIQELDVDGQVRGEYWSNGYVTSFNRLPAGSRTLTFVGAASHDIPGGSLSLFEGPLRGSAPALQPKYRCSDCPTGGPEVYLVFPPSRQLKRHELSAPVVSVGVVGRDEFSVRVKIGHSNADAQNIASAYYRIDRHGRVLDAHLGPEAGVFHEALEASGQETAATRFRNDDLWPVYRLNAKGGFDTITGPEPRAGR